MPASPVREEVVVEGLATTVTTSGPASAESAVVLLHGYGATGRYWDGLAAQIGDFARCVAPDMPGYGSTPSPVRSSVFCASTLPDSPGTVRGNRVRLIAARFPLSSSTAGGDFSVFKALRLTVPAIVLVAVVTACSGVTPTNRPTGTAGQQTLTPVADDSANPGGALTAAICRNLENLTNLDYAFGKPFSVIQNLDAASKALTLQHLTEFAQTAPVELAPAAAALVGLWTDLSTDPSSVSESDPRWQQATDSINAWRAAHC